MEEVNVEKYVGLEEKKAIRTTNQVYTNKFYISATREGIIRITFADLIDDKLSPDYITTLLFTPTGLISLKGLIDSFIEMNTPKVGVDAEQPKKEREPL